MKKIFMGIKLNLSLQTNLILKLENKNYVSLNTCLKAKGINQYLWDQNVTQKDL